MHSAFRAHWAASAPLGSLLLLLDQLEETIPLMKRIWEFSADSTTGRDAILQRDIERGKVWRKQVEEGSVSETARVRMII